MLENVCKHFITPVWQHHKINMYLRCGTCLVVFLYFSFTESGHFLQSFRCFDILVPFFDTIFVQNVHSTLGTFEVDTTLLNRSATTDVFRPEPIRFGIFMNIINTETHNLIEYSLHSTLRNQLSMSCMQVSSLHLNVALIQPLNSTQPNDNIGEIPVQKVSDYQNVRSVRSVPLPALADENKTFDCVLYCQQLRYFSRINLLSNVKKHYFESFIGS